MFTIKLTTWRLSLLVPWPSPLSFISHCYPLHWWWLEIAHDEFFIVCRAGERPHVQALLNYKHTTKNRRKVTNTRQHRFSTGHGKRPHAQALLNLIMNTSTRRRPNWWATKEYTTTHAQHRAREKATCADVSNSAVRKIGLKLLAAAWLTRMRVQAFKLLFQTPRQYN